MEGRKFTTSEQNWRLMPSARCLSCEQDRCLIPEVLDEGRSNVHRPRTRGPAGVPVLRNPALVDCGGLRAAVRPVEEGRPAPRSRSIRGMTAGTPGSDATPCRLALCTRLPSLSSALNRFSTPEAEPGTWCRYRWPAPKWRAVGGCRSPRAASTGRRRPESPRTDRPAHPP